MTKGVLLPKQVTKLTEKVSRTASINGVARRDLRRHFGRDSSVVIIHALNKRLEICNNLNVGNARVPVYPSCISCGTLPRVCQMPQSQEPNLCTSETRGVAPSYVFVLLDRVDESGQPRTNDLAKSWIRADAAKKWRAQQAENKVSSLRSPTHGVNVHRHATGAGHSSIYFECSQYLLRV
jgi:hypothetical protein